MSPEIGMIPGIPMGLRQALVSLQKAEGHCVQTPGILPK